MSAVRKLRSVESIDLDDLLESWLLQMRVQRKSPHTLRNYEKAVQQYLTFCDDNDLPRELSKPILIAFMAAQTGAASYSALVLSELKLFAKFIADEEGLDASAVLSVKAPKVDQTIVADLSTDDVKAMLKACDGNSLNDRRDKALIALFVDTGMRRAEMTALNVSDVDLRECVVTIERGKGGKGRRSKFSQATAAHIDRYLRSRKQAGCDPHSGALWVSTQGKAIGYNAIDAALRRRAAQANVEGFHLHRLRHSAAVNWMSGGGSQITLMAQCGWSSQTMLGKYVRSANERLAHTEFDRLGLSIVE
jgi:integrase/recombinase XerD